MKHEMLYFRACFKKNSSLHIWPKHFSTTFSRNLPRNCTSYLSKILRTFFLVIAPFYHFLPFRVLQMMTPISYCLHTILSQYYFTPCIHSYTPACCFSRFYTLLCALVTVNTTYAIYFFLIHDCTNSLSSLHIFVHHCTFCTSLHTKTSPARGHLKFKTRRRSTEPSSI